MKFTKTLVGVVAALAFSSAAFAADGDSNWYVGVGVGQTQSRFNSDDFKANSAVIAAGYTENVYQTTSPTSYDVYAGYRLSQHFAAQVGYTDFGTLVYGSNVSGGAGLPGNAQSNIKIQAVSLGLVGTYPIYQQLSVLGEAGAFVYNSTRDPSHSGVVTTLSGTPSSTSDTGVKPFASLGLQYDVTKQVAVVGKYTYYGTVGTSDNTGRVSLNNVSLNVQYRF